MTFFILEHEILQICKKVCENEATYLCRNGSTSGDPHATAPPTPRHRRDHRPHPKT